jgi:glycosyltransferase involved in cell wall biosynthesis
MRILYFSRDYTTHDHRFLTALAGTKHEIGFLRLERRDHQLEDRPLPSEIRQIRWAGGQSPVRSLYGPRLINSLRKVIREFKPDLIHAGPIQRSAFLVALVGFHPLVTMSWGYDLLMDVNNGPAWEWAARYTLKRSDAFVGDCATIRKLAVDNGMAEDRIVTFPWGANIQKYTPAEIKSQTPIRERLGWGQDEFVLLSTRGWADIYGVEDLSRAFVWAAQERPELRLLMLGGGPLSSTIRKIFEQGGVQDLVHFPGQISQGKLPEYYRSADLYISTSHSDGTSISLLEALASGTPVLLTDIPGNKEWILNPGEVGWLFQDGNPLALQQGILHALENRQKLPAIGQAARRLAEERADWGRNFPHLLQAYRIALS